MKRIVALTLAGIMTCAPFIEARAQFKGPYTALVDNTGSKISSSNPLWIQGSFSATIAGFAPLASFASLNVSNTSVSTVLPSGTTMNIQNTGTSPVSCNFGIGSASATSNQNIVQPSSSRFFTIGSYTWVACIDQSGAAVNTVVISGGSGIGNDSGGGSSSAASTTVVNAGTFVVQDNSSYIQTLAGGVSGGFYQANLAQVNGVTASVGTGAVGSGSQRVAIGQDINTLAGSPPGTAGLPSATVLSVQGINSGTSLGVTVGNFGSANLAQETGGNLTTLAAAITSNVMQSNIKNVSGNTALVGAGATGSGSLRTTQAQDTSTIAGAAPGTAGSASPNVLSMQGIGGGTPLSISGTVTVQQPTASSLNATIVQATASNLNATVVQPGSGTNFHVDCDNCSGYTAPADNSAFTTGTSFATPFAGIYQASVTSNPLTAGSAGAVQLTHFRALMVNLETAAGAEIGTAASPMQVSVANTGANGTPIAVGGTVIVNAGTNTSTASLALEGGNLATLAGAVSTGVMQANIKNVNGITVLTGAGATGTGSQRMTVAQDTSTIAGAAPGTAGAASANVLSIQGIASMTPLAVTISGNQAVNLAQVSGVSTAIAGSSTGIQKVGIVGNGAAIIDFAGQNASSPANAFLIGGQFNTSPTTITSGNSSPLQLDNAGNLKVNVVAGGSGGGGTSSSFGSAFPASGTAMGATNGTNMIGVLADSSGRLKTDLLGNAGAILDFAGQNAATPANSIQIGGQYNASPASITSGNSSPLQLDANGNLLVNIKAGISTTVTSNAGTGWAASGLALEGGNLATLAGAVSANVMQANLKQINGVTTLTGAGASGTGAQRVTLSQDTTTIGGAPTGTAGAPATTVVTIQGISSGTAVAVAPTANSSVNINQIAGSSVSAAATGIMKVGITGATGIALDAAGQNATSPANSLLIAGQFNTSPTTITSGNMSPLQLDNAGNLKVNVVTGGGGSGGGTSSNFGSAFPTAGTAIGATTGTNMIGILADSSGRLKVDLLGATGVALDFTGQNASSPANSIQIGGQYNTSPTTLTNGNSSPLQMDNAGNVKVNVAAGGVAAQGASAASLGGSLILGISSNTVQPIIQSDKQLPINISTATTTTLIPLASGQKIYVSAWDVIANGTGTFQLEYGTGTNCAAGTTVLTGAYALLAQVGIAKGIGLGSLFQVPASNALCAVTGSAVGMQGSVSYTQY